MQKYMTEQKQFSKQYMRDYCGNLKLDVKGFL